jgi:hypothetical protein
MNALGSSDWLAEVMGRMQGPREPLEMLLGLHPVAQ